MSSPSPQTRITLFFSFEGIDGSGKTTQAKLLASALRADGREVVQVREPGGTALGESVREVLLNVDSRINDRAELLLFSAARAQLVGEVILPALERNAVVIADRFFDSTTAYQGSGRGLASEQAIGPINLFASGGTVPDRTYIVDLPVETAASRLRARESDRMEAADDDFFRRVRAGYLSLVSLERVLIVDGTQSVEDIHQEIYRDAIALDR